MKDRGVEGSRRRSIVLARNYIPPLRGVPPPRPVLHGGVHVGAVVVFPRAGCWGLLDV